MKTAIMATHEIHPEQIKPGDRLPLGSCFHPDAREVKCVSVQGPSVVVDFTDGTSRRLLRGLKVRVKR